MSTRGRVNVEQLEEARNKPAERGGSASVVERVIRKTYRIQESSPSPLDELQDPLNLPVELCEERRRGRWAG
jgi:hypothetical protein